MHKITIYFLLFTVIVFGQEVERVQIQGQITADSNEMVEGIHIYNISSQKGTVTNEEGAFTIAVAENDRLEITAIQFVGYKVIVSEKIVERKTLVLYLNPAINKLDEVELKNHDLTGDLKEDVANIETFKIDTDFDLSYSDYDDYEFAPDGQTAIEGNAAEKALGVQPMQNGFNFVALGVLAAKLIFGPPKKKPIPITIDRSRDAQMTLLKNKFDDTTLKENFGIAAEETVDFRYFLLESYIPSSYLLPENQLLLFEYVTKQSELYTKQNKEE